MLRMMSSNVTTVIGRHKVIMYIVPLAFAIVRVALFLIIILGAPVALTALPFLLSYSSSRRCAVLGHI